jgi:hypothetical protein
MYLLFDYSGPNNSKNFIVLLKSMEMKQSNDLMSLPNKAVNKSLMIGQRKALTV